MKRGRPATRRRCRTKNCFNDALAGEKVCAACRVVRNKRRAARQATPPAKKKRPPLTRRAQADRERRHSAALALRAVASTDDQIVGIARLKAAGRADGDPIIVGATDNPDPMIQKAALLKALEIVYNDHKPDQPDQRSPNQSLGRPTSPHPDVYYGKPSGPRRTPGGTRTGTQGGKNRLRDPESRYPRRLRGD